MRKSYSKTINFICFIAIILIALPAFSQTGGDAIIYPDNYIGKKIEYFFFDIKGNASGVNTTAKATDYYVTDDMNGIRVSIYGDLSHPAHPAAGQVVASEYTAMINSINNAKAARSGKDFYVFASKKLDGQNSFPEWTKDANGVIVTEYVKLLTDYFQLMKNEGITIDYLAIQNEEAYNEGNITAAKHKAIVDSMRNVTASLGVKMPLIVGYEDYGPDKNNWMKNLSNGNWMSRMDIYGTHYYPHLRPMSNLLSDLNYANAANKPFWSTEPHWDSKDTADDWDEAEQGMCAFWDQIEVGMSGFMWWAYARTGSLRGNLMRTTSVPMKNAQMIDMNDIDGKSTNTYGKLQTRAFREGNIVTVYAVNNNATTSYSNYGFGLSVGTISGSVSYTQWLKSGSINGTNGTVVPESNTNYRLTLPAESITVFSFNVDTQTSLNNILNKILDIYPNPVDKELNVRGMNGTERLQIFDLSGKKVEESNTSKINTFSLSKGVYFVRTTNGEVTKFIKK